MPRLSFDIHKRQLTVVQSWRLLPVRLAHGVYYPQLRVRLETLLVRPGLASADDDIDKLWLCRCIIVSRRVIDSWARALLDSPGSTDAGLVVAHRGWRGWRWERRDARWWWWWCRRPPVLVAGSDVWRWWCELEWPQPTVNDKKKKHNDKKIDKWEWVHGNKGIKVLVVFESSSSYTVHTKPC